MIEINSTMHALYNKQYLCSVCQSKYSNRPDANRMLAKVKKAMACETVMADTIHRIHQDNYTYNYQTCIGNFFSRSVMSWVEASHSFEQGAMPYEGGVLEQPAKAIDVLSMITTYRQKKMAEASKVTKSKVKDRARGLRGGE